MPDSIGRGFGGQGVEEKGILRERAKDRGLMVLPTQKGG
jgi:hypothetical protein